MQRGDSSRYRQPSGFRLGSTRSALVVGFISWLAMLSAFQDFTERITQGALEETLEQQALSPWGLGRVVLWEAVAANTSNLLVVGIVLLLASVVTGLPLHIPVADVTAMLVLLSLQGAAFGVAMGGLALQYKRVEASFQLWQFIFIGFLLIPGDRSVRLRLVPFVWTHGMLQDIMVRGARAVDMLPAIAGAAGIGLAYFALGWALFRRAERSARVLGRLGHY